jgi:hypothetical protein
MAEASRGCMFLQLGDNGQICGTVAEDVAAVTHAVINKISAGRVLPRARARAQSSSARVVAARSAGLGGGARAAWHWMPRKPQTHGAHSLNKRGGGRGGALQHREAAATHPQHARGASHGGGGGGHRGSPTRSTRAVQPVCKKRTSCGKNTQLPTVQLPTAAPLRVQAAGHGQWQQQLGNNIQHPVVQSVVLDHRAALVWQHADDSMHPLNLGQGGRWAAGAAAAPRTGAAGSGALGVTSLSPLLHRPCGRWAAGAVAARQLQRALAP